MTARVVPSTATASAATMSTWMLTHSPARIEGKLLTAMSRSKKLRRTSSQPGLERIAQPTTTTKTTELTSAISTDFVDC
ncbi:hypothetical protein [Microbacterium sp. SL62]|uniref:hypothetical protein n=1 Tax=Microbacterium sp. SL62 TaxID=2995139 RepID=UPI002DD441EA|nr:hypothetical protein [Microbacterium sp. SL62]